MPSRRAQMGRSKWLPVKRIMGGSIVGRGLASVGEGALEFQLCIAFLYSVDTPVFFGYF